MCIFFPYIKLNFKQFFASNFHYHCVQWVTADDRTVPRGSLLTAQILVREYIPRLIYNFVTFLSAQFVHAHNILLLDGIVARCTLFTKHKYNAFSFLKARFSLCFGYQMLFAVKGFSSAKRLSYNRGRFLSGYLDVVSDKGVVSLLRTIRRNPGFFL